MQVCDGCHEAQTQAVARTRPTALQPVEAAEDLFLFRHWDTGTVITDHGQGQTVRDLEFETDGTALRRVLESVLDEVDEELRDEVAIGFDPDVCGAPRWRGSPVEEGSTQGIVDCPGS